MLINLDNVPERRLRMTELASAVMLSSGGLTRLVGTARRARPRAARTRPLDARGFNATLTEGGRALLAAARVTHDAVIEELVGARLSPPEITTLAKLVEHVLGADPA